MKGDMIASGVSGVEGTDICLLALLHGSVLLATSFRTEP